MIKKKSVAKKVPPCGRKRTLNPVTLKKQHISFVHTIQLREDNKESEIGVRIKMGSLKNQKECSLVGELVLCTTIWSSMASAQIDTGGKNKDSDPTGDDSGGLGDPTGDDTFSGDPTGDDDPPPPPAVAPPPSQHIQPSAQQPPAAGVSPSSPTGASVASNPDTISPNTGSLAPSSTPTLPVTAANDQSNNGSNGGAIAGGIFGVLGGLALLAAIVFFFFRKKRQQNEGMMGTTTTLPSSAGPHQQLSNNDDLEVFRPQNEEMVGFHAWNAASSSDMLASSAAHHAPAPPPPPHQYIPGYGAHSTNSH
ncbi:hypothetical protein BDA99DRAFT_534441 [Phascolomyces articulosus]|uniref:Uncharacterized protein n=1 Tax=Phascolomyces articulosus TaxID=60185 RepID=A0AAD5PG47_9FUNG|nr:hypothetical protein BDA99DRAFT_534441 [Phascolomyces articulosus]